MITQSLLKRMCDARSTLQSDHENPPKIAALAREVGVSTERFIKLFRALFGLTPLQCRNRSRVQWARAALKNSDESATQMALALGFATPGSFSRVFAQHAGVSPRAFRKGTDVVAEPPAGCVELMNIALGHDVNFGEVAPAQRRHDEDSCRH